MFKANAHNSPHLINKHDQVLLESIKNNRLQLVDFNHETHIKLAYSYLVLWGFNHGSKVMKKRLIQFLRFNGVDRSKFHVTLTQGWMMAVWHFMQNSVPARSANEFLQANPVLLNKDILLSHYSHDLLFSAKARKKFVHPDLSPLPEVA